MRRAIGSVALVALWLLTAAPAWAKCGSETGRCLELERATARITGPGLSDPIRIDGDRFWDSLRQGGIAADSRLNGSPPPDAAHLGPRYRIVYRMEFSNGELARVVQYLYPHAPLQVAQDAHPVWTYTPPGQTIRGVYVGDVPLVDGWAPVKSRWWVSSSLYHTLVAAGLPQESTVVPPRRTVTAPRGEAAPRPAGQEQVVTSDQSDGVIWLVLVSLATLLGAGAVLGRSRRTRVDTP